MTNLDSILKSRDIICQQGPSSQGYGFSSSHVQMLELEKKAECQSTDAFELSCWRRLLRVPWTARRSNQSILKEMSPGCSLEGLMLKLKLQYFGHLMRRVDSLEKPWCWEGLGAGGEGDNRGWDCWMALPPRWTWVFSELWELVMDRETRHVTIPGVTKSRTGLSDWTEYELQDFPVAQM